MRYRIVLTQNQSEELRKHILSDRSKEHMAVVLCGIKQLKDELCLLARYLILIPAEAYSRQSSAYLELLPEVQRHILSIAADERLSQVDFHSHPGESPYIGFSGIDDHHEQKLALYIQQKIPGTYYASVVMNNSVFDARMWEADGNKVQSRPVASIRWGDLDDQKPCSLRNETAFNSSGSPDDRFSRQVLAFGSPLQERLRAYRIGVIGAGGIGGIIIEMLARLGLDDWVLIDDDTVEMSNLNRLPGSTQKDVYRGTPKVNLAHRNIMMANPYASVRRLPVPVSDPAALQAMKSCDLLIVATDNHSSRLIANRLSVQYLIPLIHVGVNIDVNEERQIIDMSGEYVIPSPGKWCLQCAGIIDGQMAGWELADSSMRNTLKERGYIKDTPAPAVYHLNGVIASLAVSEIHNLIYAYKPLRRYLTYDALKGELLSLDTVSNGECSLCSAEDGISGLGDLETLPDYTEKTLAFPSADQYGDDETEDQHPDHSTDNESDTQYHSIRSSFGVNNDNEDA